MKRHAEDENDLTLEKWTNLRETIKEYLFIVKKEFKATDINWSRLMNNAHKINSSPHYHIHIMPRGDLEFKNEIFEDDRFGDHYYRFWRKELPEEKRKEVIKEMKETLKNYYIFPHDF